VCPPADGNEEVVLLAFKELRRSKISRNKARTRREQVQIRKMGWRNRGGLLHLQITGAALAAGRSLFLHPQACALSPKKNPDKIRNSSSQESRDR